MESTQRKLVSLAMAVLLSVAFSGAAIDSNPMESAHFKLASGYAGRAGCG